MAKVCPVCKGGWDRDSDPGTRLLGRLRCPECGNGQHGSEGKSSSPCPRCQGKGHIPCPYCEGKGVFL